MAGEAHVRLGAPFDFEAPVWWDPKARDVIMKPRNFVPALLVMRGPMMVLATEEGTAFSGELSRITISYPKQFDIPTGDIRHGGQTVRFYFCMPHPKVPEFDPPIVQAITRALEADGWGGPPTLAEISVPRMMAHTTLHVGKKRMERLQGLLG